MINIYKHTERGFEKLTSLVTAMLSNSITFIIALCTVIFWLSNKKFYTQDIHAAIGDVILGLTFLTLFIIQRSFNHFSASLHLKVNELVASHKPASNAVINAEEKTEAEITELSKEYAELVEETEALKKATIVNHGVSIVGSDSEWQTVKGEYDEQRRSEERSEPPAAG
jgi:low affinity Fe/Cu permease